MKILFLTLRIPWPLNDGGAIATYKLMEYLVKSGNTLTLLAFNTQKHFQPPEVMQAIAKTVAIPLNTTPRLLPLIANFFFSNLPYNVERFLSYEYSTNLIQLLENQNFDIIQLEGIYMALYVHLIQKHSKAPVVLRAHNVESQIWQRMQASQAWGVKKWYYGILANRIEIFEKAHLPYFDGIVAISNKDEQRFIQWGYRKNSITIPAGIEVPAMLATEANYNDSDKISACFLGSLEWLPNVQGLAWFLEKVWPTVHSRFPMIEFSIAGKKTPAFVQQWQYKYPHVSVVGEVPDAYTFISKHQLIIIPLLSGSGMRLKLLEAMAAGKAIICTPVAAEGIPVTHEKEVLFADSIDTFVACFEKIITNRDLLITLGNAARNMVIENYNWESQTVKLMKFYQKIIDQK
jgi:glycosyltransferase involved in cell wall biosynthesis